jgi:hypothetical protein
MDAQQEFFTRLKLDLEAKGYNVYDGALPPAGTPYPFIYLGDNMQSEQDTKSELIGDVSQTVHIWHNSPEKRGTVSKMLVDVKATARAIAKTPNFAWLVRIGAQRILTDNTTKTPLVHGVVEVAARFS